jgi:hypothetical protein
MYYIMFYIILVQLYGNKCCAHVWCLWLLSEECGDFYVLGFYLIVVGASPNTKLM